MSGLEIAPIFNNLNIEKLNLRVWKHPFGGSKWHNIADMCSMIGIEITKKTFKNTFLSFVESLPRQT